MTNPQLSQKVAVPLDHDKNTLVLCTTVIHSHTTIYEACPITHVLHTYTQKDPITSFLLSTVTERIAYTQIYDRTSTTTEHVFHTITATSSNHRSLSTDLNTSNSDSETSYYFKILVGLCVIIITLQLSFNTPIPKTIILWAYRNARFYFLKVETLLEQQPNGQPNGQQDGESVGNGGVGHVPAENDEVAQIG